MSKFEADKPLPEDSAASSSDKRAGADYDAWAREKIENALRLAKERPEARIPIEQVWKRFGIEN